MNEKLHTIFSESECPSHSRLMEYAQGKLPEGEMHLIERHLVDCEMCSDELEGLSRMKNPADLDRIAAEIGNDISRRQGRILGMTRNTFLMAAAAVVIFLAGSVFIIRLLTLNEPGTLMTGTGKLPEPSVMQESASPSTQAPAHAMDKLSRTKQKPLVVEAKEEAPAVAGIMVETEPEMNLAVVTEMEIPDEAAPVATTMDEDSAPAAGTVAPSPVATECEVVDGKVGLIGAAKESRKTAQPGRMDIAMNTFNAGDYKKAVALFEQVLKDEPGNSGASYYLAYSLFRLHEPDRAVKALKQILSDSGDVYYRKAVELSDSLK